MIARLDNQLKNKLITLMGKHTHTKLEMYTIYSNVRCFSYFLPLSSVWDAASWSRSHIELSKCPVVSKKSQRAHSPSFNCTGIASSHCMNGFMRKLALIWKVMTVVNHTQGIFRTFLERWLIIIWNINVDWVDRKTHTHSLGADWSPPVACSTENRTVLLSTRPEDILDPGDGAAWVPLAGSGASGGSGWI